MVGGAETAAVHVEAMKEDGSGGSGVRLVLVVDVEAEEEIAAPVFVALLQAGSVPSKVFLIGRVDLQAPQGILQDIPVPPDLASLSAGTRGDFSIEELLMKPLLFHAHQMAAPAQLKLSQHGADAEDSRPHHCVRVQDPVLPPQL
nr:unnamed protein product [Spirometra erinaceieuropaei]